MPKKVIINESTLKRIISEEYVDKKDIKDLIQKDKTLEKKVRAIVTDTLNDLFRVLWQRRNFYDAELKK